MSKQNEKMNGRGYCRISPPSPTSVTSNANKEKFRCYPCQNFVISGGCPYHERCTFVHDWRLSSNRLVYRTSVPISKKNEPKDTFFWPDVVSENNEYNIPHYFVSQQSDHHNLGIFSLWAHFTDFISQSRQSDPSRVYQTKLIGPTNSFTKANRLPVFVLLSEGKNI